MKGTLKRIAFIPVTDSVPLMKSVIGVMLCGLLPWTAAQATVELYVATNGSDSATGSPAAPFHTLERARNEIRRLKGAGQLPMDGVVVTVRRGTYELTNSIEFVQQDSGTAYGPIIYRAEAGAEVRLSGGRIVNGWQLITNASVLERLAPAAWGHVWSSDLRNQGFTNFAPLKPGTSWGHSEAGLELFFADQPMTLARWPNEGFIPIAEVLGPTRREEGGGKGAVEGIFSVQTDHMQRWRNEPEIMAHGYWFFDWADQRQKVESIDPAKGIITLAKPYHSYGYRKGQWFYVYNLLCELDRPGEWYLDRQKGVLYFWPPAPIKSASVMVSVLPRLLTLDNVSYLTFQGFVFEGASGSASAAGEIRTSAIAVTGGTNITIADCLIRNCGSWAVTIKGGLQDRVAGCDICQTGEGGVWLEGGDRQTLTPAGHLVENCHIHHFSRWNPVYNPAVRLRGVGNRAAHNLIHDAPHMGIDFGGNDHLIEFNEIHDVVQESNDAGVIYTGRDWSMRGHVIRYNYLHDIYGRAKRGCQGIYLDDCFSSATVFGNVFFRVTGAGFIGGGRDCVVVNNLFVDCSPALHVDARGLNWYGFGKSDLTQKLEQMPYRKPPWSIRYPQLLSLLEDQPMAPKGNLIASNICWGGKWADLEGAAAPFLNLTNNLVDVDPKFAVPDSTAADSSLGRFRFAPDSPAWKLGFQPIPLEQIGLFHFSPRPSQLLGD